MNLEDRLSEHRRPVYMILSPRALPYARLAIQSLLASGLQDLDLHLITDSVDDKIELTGELEALQPAARHHCTVIAEAELADREAALFGPYPHLRSFRAGHPCWRKITDPLLLGEPGQELVLLDPDLYFPNPFQFEVTPETGVLLMWQRPNCLLPPEIVRTAMDQGIPLAHHVDIGVAHWRAGQDLDWLNWLIGTLGGPSLPRAMHIEAIVWAAIAMHDGGGHLDPRFWVCWHRTQVNRVKRKLGVSGPSILQSEPWNEMKCFHGGGEAKWWLAETQKDGLLHSGKGSQEPGKVVPFVPLTPQQFSREQSAKQTLRKLGYYKVFGS